MAEQRLQIFGDSVEDRKLAGRLAANLFKAIAEHEKAMAPQDDLTAAERAVDMSQCPSHQYGRLYNRCACGRCKVCGFQKHMAVHGPFYGQPPGSQPYDHEFVALDRLASEGG